MKFLDGLIGTAGVFLERKVTLDVVDGMYELAVQQWGARESAKLDTEAVHELTRIVADSNYRHNGVDLCVQQKYGVITLTVPAWAVKQLHHDMVHGNICLPFIEC